MINIADLEDTNDPQGRSYREVNAATRHKFSVGDLVELDNSVRMFIGKLTRDCDGTPLYSLTADNCEYITPALVHGHPEDGMFLIQKREQ